MGKAQQNIFQQNVQVETCPRIVAGQFALAFLSVLVCTYPALLQ